MKWTGVNELRESYLSFFESKEHLRLGSAPLVPKDDNSILLINAGMTPLKKYFQGKETPPSKRAASCQKCVRTPDIENVGFTARHGTYFEMLGNFSFGDYFKTDAIKWAWEYLTEVLEIPEERLYVSIYEEDDEAGDIWVNETSVPRERIVKLGKEDNFWEHGTGPCGPCSEIHFDRGDAYGCGKPDCTVGCDCDRYIEIWNLVFTQLDSDGKGNYTPLAFKNIDTGMGLERLACVIQEVDNLFEIDTVRNIMKKICGIINKTYKENSKDDISIRIITDHIRSATFMASDGVRPSNEGRGYVMRRLLRRAARHGRILRYKKSFLYKVCDTVIDENISAYPELEEKRDYIKKVIQTEEESFSRTVEKGLEILDGFISDFKGKITTLSGEKVFRLHDTYGFPFDLTKEILLERGFSADEDGFRGLMKIQRDTARKHQAFKGGWDGAITDAFAGLSVKFTGYETLTSQTKLLRIIKDGKPAESCGEGDDVLVLIEETPFYAESGGQVGDTGTITNGDNIIEISDTKKFAGGLSVCIGTVKEGVFYENDAVTASVAQKRRAAIMRNHTAAHLLQASLREVLGEHVHQAGSYVDPEHCRFDFSHFSAVTTEELKKIEEIINEKILEGIPVITEEMPLEQAQKKGAMALFGEKYGNVVRVVEIGEFSTEFCGGTHLDNTSKAGLFKIISESSVAGGVRRIEAVTGFGVLEHLEFEKQIIGKIAALFKVANPINLIARCEAAINEAAERSIEIEKLRRSISSAQLSGLKTEKVNNFILISGILTGISGDNLRKAADEIKTENDCYIILLAGIDKSGGKGNLLCKCGTEAVARGAHAGNIIKLAAQIAGGKGGGKADSAMAGIGDLDKTKEALDSLAKIAETIV